MTVATAVLISFILEILEIFVQYKETLKDSISRLYGYYSNSSFIFYAVHFGYLWILFVSLYFDNLTWPIILALVLKSLDIFTKLDLIKKLFIDKDIEYVSQIGTLLESKLPVWVYMVGPVTYPYLIYLALT